MAVESSIALQGNFKILFFRAFPGSGGFQNVAGRVGSGQEVFETSGSGRIGSRGFQISRVRSGQVTTCQNLRGSGRVESVDPT